MTKKAWAALAAIVALLLIACGPAEGDDPDDNPVRDRVLTLTWFSDQPYKARWAIQGEQGAKPPEGLNPTGEELVASGKFEKQLIVGPTPLIVTITVVMAGKYDIEAWVKIAEDGKEMRYQKADSGTRQAITVYHYKPRR